MRFGICCGLRSFAPQPEGQPLSAVPRLMDVMQEAGVDYIEFTVAEVTPEQDDGAFERLREALEPYPLRVEAFNSFIPAHHRITGPDVDLERVLNYCRIALLRCKALGGEVVVLGSAGARKVPEGFDRAKAEQQLVEFCQELGVVAEEVGIDIALEPLNSKEDNLLLTVKHGAHLVDTVGHPRIRLLADLYHMSEENEPLDHVATAGPRLRHTHVADLGRVAPGFAAGGEEDFVGFFHNLRAAGYDAHGDGRCSFEGKFSDIEKQAKPVIALLRQRWEETSRY